ncbi:MAG: hypothetical protein WBG24_15075 [Syntrophobacteria bacterium]
MAIDPSRFELHNVADTCAVWNVLSSRILYSTASSAGCGFCLTQFVYYECLFKPRSNPTKEELELQDRLRRERAKGDFRLFSLNIDDLQDVVLLENRNRLSKGELSSIAFAIKTQQAFLTDDQKARKLATEVMDSAKVQTTPHLFGWLCFTSRLGDGDKDTICKEHIKFNRPLAQYFEIMYQEALRCRLMAHKPC